MNRRDVPDAFRRQLTDAYDNTVTDESEFASEFHANLDDEQKDKIKQHRALVHTLHSVVATEHEALVTRLQIERETLYNDYDRLRSEAELRFSIFIPLTALSIVTAVLLSGWALVSIVLPVILLAQGVRMQARANLRVSQALVTGVVQSPTLEQLTALYTKP